MKANDFNLFLNTLSTDLLSTESINLLPSSNIFNVLKTKITSIFLEVITESRDKSLSILLAKASFSFLLISMLFYWFQTTFKYDKKTVLGKIPHLTMCFANFTLAVLLFVRWIESGHFPLSNLYESLIFLSWGLTTIHLILENLLKKRKQATSNLTLGAITSPVALFTNAFATFSLPQEMQKVTVLVPALQSNWLMMHVSVMIISYAALLSGSLLAVAFLVIKFLDNKEKNLETLSTWSIINGKASLSGPLQTGQRNVVLQPIISESSNQASNSSPCVASSFSTSNIEDVKFLEGTEKEVHSKSNTIFSICYTKLTSPFSPKKVASFLSTPLIINPFSEEKENKQISSLKEVNFSKKKKEVHQAQENGSKTWNHSPMKLANAKLQRVVNEENKRPRFAIIGTKQKVIGSEMSEPGYINEVDKVDTVTGVINKVDKSKLGVPFFSTFALKMAKRRKMPLITTTNEGVSVQNKDCKSSTKLMELIDNFNKPINSINLSASLINQDQTSSPTPIDLVDNESCTKPGFATNNSKALESTLPYSVGNENKSIDCIDSLQSKDSVLLGNDTSLIAPKSISERASWQFSGILKNDPKLTISLPLQGLTSVETKPLKFDNRWGNLSTWSITKSPIFQEDLLQILDNLSYRAIGLGFALLTIGILSGAVWANEAWGSYWSWDPKETWAFITWLIFALYLHTRLSRGWVGKESAFVASFGFAIIWFCYLGVNLFGKGLHSYGWFNQ